MPRSVWSVALETCHGALCRQQAEVIQNHDNENFRNIGQGEARHRKYKWLKVVERCLLGCYAVWLL
jgi:hypothetical protein